MSFFTSYSILLVVICLGNSFGLTVRETEHDCVFINLPIAPAVLQGYLNPELQPSLHNGTAWLALNPFYIAELEVDLGGGHFVSTGQSGAVIKTVAYVSQKNEPSKVGYMIIDMDFDADWSGWVQTKGCAATQKGVNCRQSESSNVTKGSVSVVTHDHQTLQFLYSHTASVPDQALARMALDGLWKYEQEGPQGAWTAHEQHKRTHAPAQAVQVAHFQSSLMLKRHGWPGEASGSICQAGQCFVVSKLQFLDSE